MSRKPETNGRDDQPGASSASDSELEDLECLNFPGDVDWSTTLVLRCDPKGGPYTITDAIQALHEVVRRNEVFNLGPTTLNHVFTISFRTTLSTEGFVKFMVSPRMSKGLKVKGYPCTITRVPSKCVTVHVRNIPLEVDTVHIVKELSKYGSVVKTDLIKSNFRGWFQVYTNERKFAIYPHRDVGVQDFPYGIEVKGLFGSVLVDERNPKCLECYYSGHKGDACDHSGCILYKKGRV